MRKVIVCGGRDFVDTSKVFTELDAVADGQPIFIIHGGMTGADMRAGEWAESRGMPSAEVKANWDFYGKSGGPRRNRWMLLLAPDLVIAFPGNRGTGNMIAAAKDAGVDVHLIKI